jgi:hypothetical protein
MEKTQDIVMSSRGNNIGKICLRVKQRGYQDLCMTADYQWCEMYQAIRTGGEHKN